MSIFKDKNLLINVENYHQESTKSYQRCEKYKMQQDEMTSPTWVIEWMI